MENVLEDNYVKSLKVYMRVSACVYKSKLLLPSVNQSLLYGKYCFYAFGVKMNMSFLIWCCNVLISCG